MFGIFCGDDGDALTLTVEEEKDHSDIFGRLPCQIARPLPVESTLTAKKRYI
jgi:hypothetical protein